MNFLERIAGELLRAAVDLELHAAENIQYALWAQHFRDDAKDMQLKAQAFKGELVEAKD